MARRRGKSLSAVAADLLRDALERDEDMMLVRLADKREGNVKRWHSHEDVWKKIG